MNNALYIINYKKNEKICPAICYQILNQTKECFLLSLFESSIARDIYHHYFMQQTRNLRFVLLKESLVKEIISEYSNHFWYIFLSPLALYDKDFVVEIDNVLKNNKTEEFICYPHNEKNNINNFSVVINKTKLLYYANLGFDIEKITNHIKTTDNLTRISLSKAVALKESGPSLDGTCFYEDDLSLFAKFLSSPSINFMDSFVYINKRNNRLYNIVNNAPGYLVGRNNNSISIEWQLPDNKKNSIVKYWLNNVTKEYTPI